MDERLINIPTKIKSIISPWMDDVHLWLEIYEKNGGCMIIHYNYIIVNQAPMPYWMQGSHKIENWKTF